MVDDFSYGGLIIQFLTSKEFTRTAVKEGKAKWYLFEMEVPIEDWIKNRKLFYQDINIDTNNQFLNALPVTLRDKNLCYLFYYLGNKGLLALQDMLNIDRVYISCPFLCRLKPA